MSGRAPRVRFVNRVFPPAGGATGLYLAELADALAARGWAVEVATGPAADVPREETRPSGVVVRRLGGETAPKQRSILRRALAYGALWPRLVALAALGPRPDVVVLKTDPPLLLLAGPWLRRRTGARLVHWAQDVYPDVAEALGVLPRGGLAVRVLRPQAVRALRAYDAVVAVGRCMRERLIASGVEAGRVSVVPNWAPAAVRPFDPSANPFRAEHGLADRFVVMYSGNLGLAHPFEAVLDAAGALAPEMPDVLFLFVGDGPRRQWVEAEAGRRALPNVRFLPFQPEDRLAESLSAADLHLVSMEPALEGLVVPSKAYGALAAGRPVLFLGPRGSEIARVLAEHGVGETVSPPEGGALVDAICRWRADPDRLRTTGAQAAAWAAGGADRAVEGWDRLLREVAERPPAAS